MNNNSPITVEDSKIDTSTIDLSNIEIKVEAKTDDLLNEMIDDNNEYDIDEDDIASAIDDGEEKIQTNVKIEVKQEVMSMMKEEIIPESYSEIEEKYKKLKEEYNGKDNMNKVKLEYCKKLREKRIQEKWIKALMHFGIEPEIYFNNKERIMKIYPFCDYNFVKAKKGQFQRKKMEQVVLEILKFEIVNESFNVTCKDIAGEIMEGTFHRN
mmetsp:Transcript_20034/g.17712  ORF Transcript_20034/g.17712 Transcript_20034/m.17712 type:complete len:211 (-) Transcript_20034:145-777(-)